MLSSVADSFPFLNILPKRRCLGPSVLLTSLKAGGGELLKAVASESVLVSGFFSFDNDDDGSIDLAVSGGKALG